MLIEVSVEPSQYLDGGPLENTGYCKDLGVNPDKTSHKCGEVGKTVISNLTCTWQRNNVNGKEITSLIRVATINCTKSLGMQFNLIIF